MARPAALRPPLMTLIVLMACIAAPDRSACSRVTVPLHHRRGATSTMRLQQSDSGVTVPTELGLALGSWEYVVTVGLGSPPVTQSLIMDTGSDISWVHYRSSGGYDPSRSSSYAAISYSAAECSQLGEEGNGCVNSDCGYVVHYGDGSSTAGTYGTDTLALGSSTVISHFHFGCSHDEVDLGDDLVDGLIGLGGGAQSVVSQTAATLGHAFSYCLPPTPLLTGFLTLGAPSNTSGFATTPMMRSEKDPTFYFVLLEGIMVAGVPLSIPPSVFSHRALMDSGTVVTRLPPAAYEALSSAFKANMTQYPAAPPKSLLDTCFDFGGQKMVMIPSVALVFDGGAVVYLDANGIMMENCLAFPAAEEGVAGIIGNVQQRTFEVLYDVGQGMVGFRATAC